MRSADGDSALRTANRSTTAAELEIRRLTASDLSAVKAIHATIPIHDRSEAWDTFVSWYAAACQMGTFGADWEGSVIAEWRSEPAGFLLMHRESRPGDSTRSERIMVAAVDPRFWRKGIGREMALTAIEHSRHRGVRVVQSIVPESRPAHSEFLEHCGFAQVGRRLSPNGVRVYEMMLR